MEEEAEGVQVEGAVEEVAHLHHRVAPRLVNLHHILQGTLAQNYIILCQHLTLTTLTLTLMLGLPCEATTITTIMGTTPGTTTIRLVCMIQMSKVLTSLL